MFFPTLRSFLGSSACFLIPLSVSWLPSTALSDIITEIYTDQASFESRLAGVITTVDFDDVDTSINDPESFASDRYRASHGIVITGEMGQFSGTGEGFGFPEDYPPVSSPNAYAPGPTAPPNGNATDGGNRTEVSFFSGANTGSVSGFGAYFIDVDFPDVAESSLSVFDAQGNQIAIVDGFSGPNASQIFIGIITIDNSSSLPTPAISAVRLINGSGWPGVNASEGVVLDDFVFGPVSNQTLLGDVNLDGEVNLLDVAPFVEILTNGSFQAEADINLDCAVDLLDVAPFIELLSGG